MSLPAAMVPPPVSLEDTLRERFGFDAFRPWQREAIEALLEGPRRVLVVAPTGGGKSLTYQLPAVVLEGTTIVISPLIALMEDQVRGLEEKGVRATYLTSSISMDERRRRERALRDGEYDLVYVAPEGMANDYTMALLEGLQPQLVAIDEAHCISQWGHDFRPDYLRLGPAIRRLAPRHVLACTATATPIVREDILANLGFDDARVVLRGFARPNLHLEAIPLDSRRHRDRQLHAALKETLGSPKEPTGAAIVYAATRKNTEKLAGQLAKLGYRTAAYHAGLAPDARASVNAHFADGALDVVVATNAFGMGIDRADIRLVVHVQAPGSIEAYYQEVGRAGRDGEPAHGLLMSSSADLALRRRLIERVWEPPDMRPPAEEVSRQWRLFLDLMRYVEAGSCRHDFILRYFGDEEEILGGCGHCDVCERLEEGDDGGLSEEDVLVVRKALAGLARCRGRVGMRNVTDMLVGKSNQKLRRQGLDRLSTHGILKDHDPEWVLALLRRLVTAGYANITADDYPTVYLTKKGARVMKEEEQARVLLPPPVKKGRTRRGGGGSKGGPSVASEDRDLFERLRDQRRELAKARGVPAYVVCSDRTLAEIAAQRPGDEAALGAVHGMGPARIEAYGEALLGVVNG